MIKVEDLIKGSEASYVLRDDSGTYYPVWDYKDHDGNVYLIVSPDPIGKMKPGELDTITVAELKREFDKDMNVFWEDTLNPVSAVKSDKKLNAIALK